MLRLLLSCVAAAAALGAAPARAWNDVGHLAVAAIAYDQLTPATRARVKALLQLNPDHAAWGGAVGAADADKVAFMRSAYWPDAIKFKPGYVDDPQWGKKAGDIVGYADHARHRYWHYLDTPFSTDGTPLPAQAKAPNAQTQLVKLRALLASGAADDVKSYALAWVNHLVGDVHQPLHAAARFSHAHPKGDGGGNDVQVCAGRCSTLHAFWDDAVGATRTHEDPVPKALAVQQRLASYKVSAKRAAKPAETAAIPESAALARQYGYAAPVGPGDGPFALDGPYRLHAGSVAEQQIALAGARLARLLNDSLR